MSENTWNEEDLGKLLGLLKPAPRAWVDAAAELPRLRAVLDDLVERAEADAAFRSVVIADLEAALAREGVQPTTRRLEVLAPASRCRAASLAAFRGSRSRLRGANGENPRVLTVTVEDLLDELAQGTPVAAAGSAAALVTATGGCGRGGCGPRIARLVGRSPREPRRRPMRCAVARWRLPRRTRKRSRR